MDDNYNVLSVNYCSKCLSPITDEDRYNCPECGEPLELIGLDERMKRDGDMGKGLKALYLISQLMFAAGYAANIVYSIIAIVKCSSGEKFEPVKSVIGKEESFFQPLWYYGMGYSVISCVVSSFVLIYGVYKITRKNSKGMVVYCGVGRLGRNDAFHKKLSRICIDVCRAYPVRYPRNAHKER